MTRGNTKGDQHVLKYRRRVHIIAYGLRQPIYKGHASKIERTAVRLPSAAEMCRAVRRS